MTNCVVCQKEISGIDEFGTIQAPLCRDCYWKHGKEIEDKIAGLPIAYKGTIELQKMLDNLRINNAPSTRN